MPNQFSIAPAGNMSQGLSGLGSIINKIGEQRKQQTIADQQAQLQQQTVEEVNAAAQSGDVDQMVAMGIKYPDYFKQMSDEAERQTGVNEQVRQEFTTKLLTTPPAEREQLWNERVQEIVNRGGDPQHTLKSAEEWRTNPEGKELQAKMYLATANPEAWKALEASYNPSTDNREFKSADEVGVGGAQLIAFGDGSTAFVGRDGIEIKDPKERAAAIAAELTAEVVQRGEIAQTESSARATAERISGSFEQVGNIRANNAILDEVSAALDSGAKTGVIDSMFPAWNSATAVLRNAGYRLGLGVISSVTFGALSQGELDLAMQTALPTDLDEPELRQWIIERKAAQNKIAAQLEEYIIFSEQGGSAGEWLENQKGVYRQRQIDTRFGGVDSAEIQEALDYEEENGIRF